MTMTVYDFFLKNEGLIRILNRNGINPMNIASMDAYAEYVRLVQAGVRRSDAVLEAADRMHVGERQFYNVIKKMEQEVMM